MLSRLWTCSANAYVLSFFAVSAALLIVFQGAFTREEATEYVEMGGLNALFVLGRTTGFIGHWIDQKRLKQGLYRHPWDDISYIETKPVTLSRQTDA